MSLHTYILYIPNFQFPPRYPLGEMMLLLIVPTTSPNHVRVVGSDAFSGIILLEVLLKPGDPYCGHFVSVCQSVTPPVLTRGGFNPLKQKNTPKANPRQQTRKLGHAKSKQTKSSITNLR